MHQERPPSHQEVYTGLLATLGRVTLEQLQLEMPVERLQ